MSNRPEVNVYLKKSEASINIKKRLATFKNKIGSYVSRCLTTKTWKDVQSARINQKRFIRSKTSHNQDLERCPIGQNKSKKVHTFQDVSQPRLGKMSNRPEVNVYLKKKRSVHKHQKKDWQRFKYKYLLITNHRSTDIVLINLKIKTIYRNCDYVITNYFAIFAAML